MEDRVKVLNKEKHKNNVLYLMNRDQRVQHNYSVELGYDLSYKSKTRFFLGIDIIHFKMNTKQKIFIFQGISELKDECKDLCIPCYLVNDLKSFVEDFDIDCIVLDWSPLREIKKRDEEILKFCRSKKIALHLCDSHNIVPCWMLKVYKRTPKAVRTDLFKIYNKYLVEFKDVKPHSYNKKYLDDNPTPKKIKNNLFTPDEFADMKYADALNISIEVGNPTSEFHGGFKHGIATMIDFFDHRYKIYVKERNNPDIFALTNLSPWIHTGQISGQYIVLEATKRFPNSDDLYTFITEIFIWRETSEHFVFYEPNYDNIDGALGWAKESLIKHTVDKRPILYTEDELRNAKTKDKLWNAAQNELLTKGKIHGYVRMYWAKRILEWTKDPKLALKIAISFNDEYSIDGNDCNGYLGVMWSICGSMDRAFAERPIFGKIRFMRSFKAPGYISKWANVKKKK